MWKDEPVKIVLGTGPNVTIWYIHRALMVKHSPYFRAALEPNRFAEANSNFVSLPDDDSDAFEIFTQWIYSIDLARPGHPFGQVEGRDCLKLVKAYCIADKFGVAPLQFHALRALEDANRSQSTITPECIIYAFEHSIKNSALRQMLTGIIAVAIHDGTLELMYSSSNESEGSRWLELFELGGEFVSALIVDFSEFNKKSILQKLQKLSSAR